MIPDIEEAKDIVAEAFAKLSHNRERINGPNDLAGFLFVVAKHKTIDHRRKLEIRKRMLKAFVQLEEKIYVEPKESEMVHGMRLERLAFIVQKLPPTRKMIFLSYYYTNEDIKHIAGKLNLKEQTVRNQLQRAIITVRSAVTCDVIF
jgi:RNA polymerase sigma factor (sigma-70 family)